MIQSLIYLNSSIIQAEGGLFDFNATLPLMALQFLLFMTILNLVFYKPIISILDKREIYIKNNLKEASEKLKEANELTKKYEEELSKTRKEAQSLISFSKKETQKLVAIKIEEAQKETEKLVKETSEQLNAQKGQVLQVLEKEVNYLSKEIKHKLFKSLLV